MRNRKSAAALGFLTLAAVLTTAQAASAQSWERHRSAVFSGPNHTAARGADIHRSRGSAQVSRFGAVDGQGWSSARSRTTVGTGSGYATTGVRVGPAGNSQSRTATVAYGDGAYSRSAGLQTSRGYGYDRDVDAYRSDDGVTVNRSITTNSGASRSASVTRPY